MANGRHYDSNQLCAACWTYPLGTHLRVTDAHNGIFVDVMVSDRPSRRYAARIDLSPKSFQELNGLALGVCEVKIRRLVK